MDELAIFVSLPSESLAPGIVELTIQSAVRAAELAVAHGEIAQWKVLAPFEIDATSATKAAEWCRDAGGEFVRLEPGGDDTALLRKVAKNSDSRWMLLLGAGVVPAPTSIRTLLSAAQPGGGLVEARTVPVQQHSAGTISLISPSTLQCSLVATSELTRIFDEMSRSEESGPWGVNVSLAARRLEVPSNLDARASALSWNDSTLLQETVGDASLGNVGTRVGSSVAPSLSQVLAALSASPAGSVATAAESLLAAVQQASVPKSEYFLSVILRTQGTRHRELGDVLLCLSAQTDKDFEVLLVRHAVSVADAALIDAVVGEQYGEFRARIHVLDVSGGTRSVPLNYGLGFAKGSYIAVLDDDDAVLPHWVQAFHEEGRCNPGVVLRARVGTQGVLPALWPNGEKGFDATAPVKEEYPREFDLIAHTVVSYSPFMGLAFPRAVFEILGIVFDESLEVGEDWDVLMRAALMLGVADVPSLTGIYRHWSDRESSTSLHDASEWSANERTIIAQLDRVPGILPMGSVGRIRTLAAAESDAAALRSNLSSVLASRSWRFTKPLRAWSKWMSVWRTKGGRSN